MYELKIPKQGTLANKNRETSIEIENHQDIKKGTTIQFGNLDNIELTVDGIYEVETDAPTWVHLHNSDASNDGIYGIDLFWRELAERVAHGDAEIVG